MTRPLQSIDLNLLVALKALLEEENVTQAARRHGRSVPAMSRILQRLREALEDPLLVRAGGRLVPTPRARDLLPTVSRLIADAEAILEPREFHPAALDRQFTILSNDDLAAAFGGPLMAALRHVAPEASVRFALEAPESEDELRAGRIDLAIASGQPPFPELISSPLFWQRMMGAARVGHPIFDRPITPQSFAQAGHIVRSRRGQAWGPIDDALAALDLMRPVKLIVPTVRTALIVAAQTDLIATGPGGLLEAVMREGLPIRIFDLPVPTPMLAISLRWHPQFQADRAHQWFRNFVISHLALDVQPPKK